MRRPRHGTCSPVASDQSLTVGFRAIATGTVGGSSAEFAKAIETEMRMRADVAKAANLKFEQ
jgi:hypothetical protein